MKKYVLGALGACVISSMAAAATLNSINKDQVQQAFVNNTFTTASVVHPTAFSINNSFTGYMSSDGKIWGMFMHKPKKLPQVDQGTYVIKDDGALCMTWKHWHDAKEFCVYIYNAENAYLLVTTDNMFDTAFLKTSIKTGKHMKIKI